MKLSGAQTANVESEILKRVRAHPGISRVALARKLQIAPSTIGNYTGRLITQGFLTESGRSEFDAGRPPTALQLNPDGGYFIGVDFEARNIMAVAVDFSNRPLKYARESIIESDSVESVQEKIAKIISEVIPQDTGRLLAIGIGGPGLVDPVRGIAIHYKYINHWKNISLVEPLRQEFGVPVFLENNVRAMALAELWFGLGRGQDDWVCIGIRSGIGAGIVTGGELQRGTNYRAGEIGRWRCPLPSLPAAQYFVAETPVPADGIELQEIASARAVLAAFLRADQAGGNISAGKNKPFIFEDFVELARQQDDLAMQIIEVAAGSLGGAIAQISLALNPSRIILSGPLTLLGDNLLKTLTFRVEEILQVAGAETPAILHSEMGEHGGALGAAALAVHEWRPVR